jgi:hypothetical protein
MSLERVKEVDAIGVDKKSGAVALTILDSWDWSEESRHASSLSDKINSYLGFIESGELLDAYPEAKGRDVEILVISKFPLNKAGKALLDHAITISAEYGVKLRSEFRPGGPVTEEVNKG